MAVSFADASHGWVVGLMGNILATSDGGAHWEVQVAQPYPLFGVSFADASHGWAVGGNGTILATSDGGAHWSVQKSRSTAYLYGVHFSDPSHGWAVGTRWGAGATAFGVILSTSDGGATWTDQESSTQTWLYGVASSDASHGWAVGLSGTILATSDGGADWNAQSPGTRNWLCDVAFPDPLHGWAVGDQSILATSDGGRSWTVQDLGTQMWLYGIAFSDAAHGWAVGDGGTILATTDGGASWSQQSSGVAQWLNAVSCADDTHSWAVGNVGTIVATTDGGADWSTQSSGTSSQLYGVASPNVSHAWAVGNGGTILATTDSGTTWTAQDSGTQDCLYGVSFPDASHGWAVGEADTILATSDGGASWSVQNLGTENMYLYSVSFADDTHGWAVGYDSDTESAIVLATTDGGVTWRAQDSGATAELHSVASPGGGHVWTVGNEGTILVSKTAGWADTTPPVTTDDYDGLWHKSPVTVDFTATDSGKPDVSGVAYTAYSLDESTNWTQGTSVSIPAPADHTGDGLHTILYRSADNAGNIEANESCTVKIDTTPPTTTDDADAAWHNTPVTVSLTATDPNMPDASGVAATYYEIDGGAWTEGTSLSIPAPADHSNDGIHTVSYYSTDNAGNTEATQSCTVKIDTTPPVISLAYLSVSHHQRHSGWGWHRSVVMRGHQASWPVWSCDGSCLDLSYRIDDNLSPTVNVAIALLGSRGKVLQTISLGQCPTGVLEVYRLPHKLPHGCSHLRLTATDLAGNAQSKLVGFRWFMQQ